MIFCISARSPASGLGRGSQIGFGCSAISAPNFQLQPTRYDCLFLDVLIHLEEWFDRVLFDLARCRNCMVAATPRDKVLLDLCVAQMLAEVSERCSSRLSPAPAYPELLTRILAWIRQNFTADATLTAIAEHFQVSKTYVSRLFRTYLSATVTEYVNELRCNTLRNCCGSLP